MTDRLRLWRYEDLVSSTESVMREVLDFVGEPWDPIVLEHHRHQSGRAEGGTVAHEPVDTTRIDKWADVASERSWASSKAWRAHWQPSSAMTRG